MSYSFTIRALTKAAAAAAVTEKMAEVAAAQQCHKRDEQQAVATAHAFIDLLDEDETREVSVSMSGSIAGNWQGSDVTSVSGANVSISAGLVTKV